MPRISRKYSDAALELFEFVSQVIEGSPDKSCYMSERNIALALHRRASLIHKAKLELISGGALNLTLRENGNRRNPRHRLSLPPKTQRGRSSFFNSTTPNQQPHQQQYNAMSSRLLKN